MQKSQSTSVKSIDTPMLNEAIVRSIQDVKGSSIVILDLRKLPEAVADYFIVCHADSTTQVKAIADRICQNVKDELDDSPWHKEGFENLEWVLVDYVHTVVHVFHREQREFYQLEDLWSDAEITTYQDID